jgi:hypothetical protein
VIGFYPIPLSRAIKNPSLGRRFVFFIHQFMEPPCLIGAVRWLEQILGKEGFRFLQ